MAHPEIERFFAACSAGDLAELRALLDDDPDLARARHGGTTGLHRAVRHPDAVRLLLERGAEPHARDEGDDATPLFFAAGGGPIESVRALLDAGADANATGDAHRLGPIGAATVFDSARRDVVELLVERGARHHVFSAIALGDEALLRAVVAADRGALERRLSPTEQEQTALHYAIAPPDGLVGGRFRTGAHYRTLEVLIELGAELEARDAKGRTPLDVAMLRGDHEAMRRLHAAGAEVRGARGTSATATAAVLAGSVRALAPMLAVPDVEATVAWYRALGFELAGSHVEDGRMGWASVRFGGAELMFVPASEGGRVSGTGLSLWLRTERLDELYRLWKDQQLERARERLSGGTSAAPELHFTLDLYTAFYGQREFGIRDPNGVELMFYQPLG